METPSIQDLQRQIDDLQEQIDAMSTATSMPLDMEKAIRERVADLLAIPDAVAVTAIGGNAAFNLPNVTGLIKIKLNGKYYKVLYQ